MIECSTGVPTPAPEPTPAPTPPVNKRFVQSFLNQLGYPWNKPDSSIGDVCTITCDAGYVISGSDERICENDGNWSGYSTTCKKSMSYIVVQYSRVSIIL